MVNPYAVSNRPTPKGQVQLGQSQLLKKIEKLQTKHSTGGSLDRSAKKKSVFDSDDDNNNNNSESDDEDSVFKNFKKSTNKFIKKKEEPVVGVVAKKEASPRGSSRENAPTAARPAKPVVYQPSDSEEDEESDELEISANDRSSTPNRKDSSSSARPQRRILSASSSIHEYPAHHRRSPSKVKFQDKTLNSNSEDESTIMEDMFSRNLVLDINELEASISAPNNVPFRKPSGSGGGKGRGEKRSESVASIIEEDERLDESIASSSNASRSLHNTNLILDIEELERSVDSRLEKKKEKEKKQSPRSSKSKKDAGREKTTSKRPSSKTSKRVKTPTSVIDTETDINAGDDASIATEIDTEVTRTEEVSDEIRTARGPTPSRLSDKPSRHEARMRSYRDDFETSLDTTELSTSHRRRRRHESSKRAADHSFASDHSKKKSKKKNKKDKKSDKRRHKKRRDSSTSSSSSSVSKSSRRSSARAAPKTTTSRMTISNAEIQVDATDILKHTDLYKSVGASNPSSLVLASLTYLNDATNLDDLNQLTGYNLVNQAYNDLIKMNLSFFRNFLTVQRSLYQQQVNSIKPK